MRFLNLSSRENLKLRAFSANPMKKTRDLPDFALEAPGQAEDADMCESSPAESETGPERSCIVTRVKGSPDDMIRFVLGPGMIVVPDIRRKLPGRGVWVTAQAGKVNEAVKRHAFAKGFRTKAVASPSLPAEIDALLLQDCLQFLSIVNKSGAAVTGFAKVEAAVESGQIAGLLHASDGGADGVRKLGQALRRRFGDGQHRPQIKLFTNEQLDLALGRTNVIHAALMAGTVSEAFVARCRRLAVYRSEAGSEAWVEPVKKESDGTPEQDGRVLASSKDFSGLDGVGGFEAFQVLKPFRF